MVFDAPMPQAKGGDARTDAAAAEDADTLPRSPTGKGEGAGPSSSPAKRADKVSDSEEGRQGGAARRLVVVAGRGTEGLGVGVGCTVHVVRLSDHS